MILQNFTTDEHFCDCIERSQNIINFLSPYMKALIFFKMAISNDNKFFVQKIMLYDSLTYLSLKYNTW